MSILFLSDQDIQGLTFGVLVFFVWYLVHKSTRYSFHLLVSILSAFGGIIIGFTLSGYGTQNEKVVDFVVACVIISFSMIAGSDGSKKLLLGYVIHAVWAMLHHIWFSHLFSPRTSVPYWYPLFSLVFDLGVFFYYYEYRIEAHKHKR